MCPDRPTGKFGTGQGVYENEHLGDQKIPLLNILLNIYLFRIDPNKFLNFPLTKTINPMKTTIRNFSKALAVSLSMLLISSIALADGLFNEVYSTGTTSTAAGSYVVQATDNVYLYQGDVYKVYNVYYDNPQYNMKIAVKDVNKCKTYLAYTDNYWFKYKCSKDGFGVRKVMFDSPSSRDQFDPLAYSKQVILQKEKLSSKIEAVDLMASFVPKLKKI